MVVLAASILEKGRKNAVLYSRQFIPMPKVRIESLLQVRPDPNKPLSTSMYSYC